MFISERDRSLWKRIASTVTRLGLPQPCRPAMMPIIMSSIAFPTTLDLHGYKIHDAYLKTIEYLKNARYHNLKTVIIITGKSGKINEEFPYWLDKMSFIRSINQINGGGAWRVIIKNS